MLRAPSRSWGPETETDGLGQATAWERKKNISHKSQKRSKTRSRSSKDLAFLMSTREVNPSISLFHRTAAMCTRITDQFNYSRI